MAKFRKTLGRSQGVTPSERRLKQLCDHSFLSLWSYASVFRDQGSAGGREGKEVCDVLIVFGDHVLIFSDKDCAFPSSGNVRRDWPRWYKRAVGESANQIFGAERWIRSHPDRMFLDRKCTERFPIPLPPPDRAKIHRVVVAHGSGPACAAFYNGGSGSLLLDSTVIGANPEMPFAIGYADTSKRFVHVLDDVTFDLLLRALDTITDFVNYLAAKETLFANHFVLATGEEDLLGRYLGHLDKTKTKHGFGIPADLNGIVITEGEWISFAQSAAAKSQEHADEVSYAWDRLIETFARQIGDQHQEVIPGYPQGKDNEPALRLMAAEPRVSRRWLASSLIQLLEENAKGRRVRLMRPLIAGGPAYIFMSLDHPAEIAAATYRLTRIEMLSAYCMVAKLKLPDVRHFVGIATEPGVNRESSEDLAAFDSSAWSSAHEEEAQSLQRQFGILTDVKMFSGRVREYPNQSSRPPIEPGARRNPRNCSCPCGSGVKYKRCCGRRT